MTEDDKLSALALIEADLRQDAQALGALGSNMSPNTFLAVLNVASFLIRELATHIACDPQAITDQLRADLLNMKGKNNE